MSPEALNPRADPASLATAPTTGPQREIWTAAQLGREASLAFNESRSLRLRGPLNLDALRRSVDDLASRHEALRATFSPDGSTLMVSAPAPLDVPLDDLMPLPGSDRAPALADILAREVEEPFDLERGPLFRVRIVRLDSEDHNVVFTAHHSVCDGWSTAVILRDWARLYSCRCRAVPLDLPPAVPFSGYARSRAKAEHSAQYTKAEQYWIGQLAGGVPSLDLPSDRPRPPMRTFASRRVDAALPAKLVRDVERLGATHGASLFATMLAAFTVLLHRLSGQNDIVVGIPAAGQAADHLDNLVGHCVTTLPLRTHVPHGQPFVELLRAVRTTVMDAYDHQALTYGDWLRRLSISRDPSRLPLVSVLFNIDQALDARTLTFHGLSASLHANPRHFEGCELLVNGVASPTGLVLECHYNTDLFDEATVRRWLEGYELILESIVAEPSAEVESLAMLTESERRLLVDWNRTEVEAPTSATVHGLVSEQISRSPERIAVVQGETQITYRQLERRVRQLTGRLRTAGAQPGGLIGLLVERSPDMVAALLAILEVGCAYVPLDPSFPSERLRFVVEDSRMSLVVTQQALVGRSDLGSVRLLLIDEADDTARSLGESLTVDPESLCYVIYTSGSTGKPKGVQIPHRAVVNFLRAMRQRPGLGIEDRLLAVTTISFDIAVLELLLPLVVGARVVLATRDEASDGACLKEMLDGSGATVMQATPATWRMLLDAGWRGRAGFTVLCGGEALPRDLAEGLLERAGVVWNMYGPTETTVWSTCWRVESPVSRILIGRPIANTQVHVLDSRMQPCPLGVPGDLWIGGDGVAHGYLNRPELTAERFVPDPFRAKAGARIHRTGDLARWWAGGELECLGRTDFQVKVRGHRIELEEIEATLMRHPAVARAVVTLREDRPGDVRLVAYPVLTQDGDVTGSELRDHLRQSLPEYMVPAHVVEIDELPLLPTGKIDRRSLPSPGDRTGARATPTAPRTESERLLAAVWSELLGVGEVGVQDNFFELGGHSLLCFQAISRIERQTGVHLRPREMLMGTLEALAPRLEEGRRTRQVAAPRAMRALYFGRRPNRLFGVYSAPDGPARRDAAVLLCYPGPQEYMYAHWAFRKLARLLVREGFPVLRFDYYGTGDSAGESHEGSLERWRDDIVAAARELRDLAGTPAVSVVGFRLGAVLATRAPLAVRHLVLWEPVVAGPGYLDELRRMHELQFAHCLFPPPARPAGGDEELMGVVFPAHQRDETLAIDLLREKPACTADSILIVGDPERGPLDALQGWLEASAGVSGVDLLPMAEEASRVDEPLLLSSGAQAAIANALAGASAR